MPQGIAGYSRASQYNQQGNSYANRILNRLPWGLQSVENITELNPKYELFSNVAPTRDERLSRLSVFNNPYGFVRRYWMKDGTVVTNPGNATAQDIINLARQIADSVYERFGISIHPEVNYI